MRLDITITDADRNIDFRLAVELTVHRGSRARRGWRDGGEPGEGPGVEIDRARCLEIAIGLGGDRYVTLHESAVDRHLQSRLGAWCLGTYSAEITDAVHRRIFSRRGGLAG